MKSHPAVKPTDISGACPTKLAPSVTNPAGIGAILPSAAKLSEFCGGSCRLRAINFACCLA